MIMPAFTYRHFVLTILLGLVLAVHVFAPKAAFELDMVLALAAVMAPWISQLSDRLGGRRGLAVVIVSIAVLIPLGLFAVFVVPAAATSLRDMLISLKDQMPALRQLIEEWIVTLGMTSAGFDIDETFGKANDSTRVRADLLWRISPKHHVGMMYFDNRISRTKTLSKDIVWGDNTYKAGANVASDNKFKVGDTVRIEECAPISKTKRWTVVVEA